MAVSNYQRGVNDARRDARVVLASPLHAAGYLMVSDQELTKAARKGLTANGFEETEDYWLGYEHAIGMIKKGTLE